MEFFNFVGIVTVGISISLIILRLSGVIKSFTIEITKK